MYKFKVIKWTAIHWIYCNTQQMLRFPLTLLYSNGSKREEVVQPSVILPSGNYGIINVWGAEGHGLSCNSHLSLCILNACILYPGDGILIPTGPSDAGKKKKKKKKSLFFHINFSSPWVKRLFVFHNVAGTGLQLNGNDFNTSQSGFLVERCYIFLHTWCPAQGV